jgi:hypothetical protein
MLRAEKSKNDRIWSLFDDSFAHDLSKPPKSEAFLQLRSRLPCACAWRETGFLRLRH